MPVSEPLPPVGPVLLTRSTNSLHVQWTVDDTQGASEFNNFWAQLAEVADSRKDFRYRQ